MNFDDHRAGARPIGRLGAHGAAASVSCGRDSCHDAIVFVLRGEVTVRELTDAFDRALDLGFAQCLIWNVVDADLSKLSLDQLESLVERVLAGPWEPRKWAILGAPGPSLAAAAMLAATAEGEGFGERVEAFVDRVAAFDWLATQERPTTPADPDPELLRR